MEALEVVYGEPRDRTVALNLVRALRTAAVDGTIYLGYPVLASADERVPVDALLVGAQHGLVAFQLGGAEPHNREEWDARKSEQDRLYAALESNLGRHDSLRQGRRLAVTIETVTVFPSRVAPPKEITEGHFCGLDDVGLLVSGFPGLDATVLRALQAALQRVTTIKPPKKRAGVRTASSRGGVLKEIEKGIANLDHWQKRAAIETPDGPQRIRGLAGSGKTIVLALKAAYLHAQHPDWTIAVTFHTRSLYQQFEDLVTRFSFEHIGDKPDFERLRLMHAWGGSDRDGVYTTLARASGATPRDFLYGRSMYGSDSAFQGVCRELLAVTATSNPTPTFDAILIDEAQDLPPEFFQLVYRFTADPKRIIWAYDELQKLSEAAMPSTRELFGTDERGNDLVNLSAGDGEARRDIILPVCYRNSPWALATAHSLGFGLYSSQGLVQHFDEPSLWREIGYRVVSGELEGGKHVTLERDPESTPDYFPRLITRDDAVTLEEFANPEEQDNWVATQITANLSNDELERDDVLIVLPNAYTSKSRAQAIIQALARHGVAGHLAGVTTSRDEIFRKNSVAIAHIYRAKGNEAPMVYVLDSQYAIQGPDLITRRNTLFTAITRSRAWVRICCSGPIAAQLRDEVASIKSKAFQLKFKVPTPAELGKMRKIHRDRTQVELASIKRATDGLKDFLKAIEREELDIETLPPEMRTKLARLLREGPREEDDDQS